MCNVFASNHTRQWVQQSRVPLRKCVQAGKRHSVLSGPCPSPWRCMNNGGRGAGNPAQDSGPRPHGG